MPTSDIIIGFTNLDILLWTNTPKHHQQPLGKLFLGYKRFQCLKFPKNPRTFGFISICDRYFARLLVLLLPANEAKRMSDEGTMSQKSPVAEL